MVNLVWNQENKLFWLIVAIGVVGLVIIEVVFTDEDKVRKNDDK